MLSTVLDKSNLQKHANAGFLEDNIFAEVCV